MAPEESMPTYNLDPGEFPFDRALLEEILVRVARLHWADRRWLMARIAHDIWAAGEAR
jgi:hypothetical protein